MEAPKAEAKRGHGQHGTLPLSRASRRRLLGRLVARADQGDVAACEALVRLSIQAERLGQSAAICGGAEAAKAHGNSHSN